MIADGRDLNQLRHAPWTSVSPGLAIGAAVLGFNLLGDALARRARSAPRREERRDRGAGVGAHLSVAFDVERLRREEFPWAAAGEAIYLNAASTGPLPAAHACARRRRTRASAPRRTASAHEEQFARARRCARADRARSSAPTPGRSRSPTNTGAGSTSRRGRCRSARGDVVVIPDLEFPANVYPWMAAARGARLHPAASCRRATGCSTRTRCSRRSIRPSVRVLSLSWVGFATGARRRSRRARRGVPRARRATSSSTRIQGLGPLPLDVAATPHRHPRLRRAEVAALAVGHRLHLRAPRARASRSRRSR